MMDGLSAADGSEGKLRSLGKVLSYADANMSGSLDRLLQLLRIPSISCDPLYAGQCQEAARWLSDELGSIGFGSSVRQTAGHPVVVAHHKKTVGPHVLFYGHYDVQPVEPLDQWEADPFNPQLRVQPNGDSHIVARGASDDKGQLLTFVEACRAWKSVTGDLPISVSMFFEGEEESGSPSMDGFLDQAGDELTADIMLLCDTYLWEDAVPAITVMFRGLLEEEIEITCANRDLHSGAYGNAARNPIQVLAEVIASLRGPRGEVAIAGFYDDVKEIGQELKSELGTLHFDTHKFLENVGLSQSAGDQTYSVLEQVWTRPSCEINGIAGGYYGDGLKTIIPSKATAKVSFRLVDGQDPKKIRTMFHEHIRSRIPADCAVKFTELGGSTASVIPSDSEYLRRARAALKDEWGCKSVLIGSGGSIPIVSVMQTKLSINSLPIGFARSDNRHHSPNEKYDLSSFQKGIRSWIRILAELSADAGGDGYLKRRRRD
nr:M20/M25/M40 family metallo-hydrolase [Rhizobium leguminosarum]